MSDAACCPSRDAIQNLADAMGRHALAHAASGLDLISPEVRRHAEALEAATVNGIEDASQALMRQVGADRYEQVWLGLLRGMRSKADKLLEMAAA